MMRSDVQIIAIDGPSGAGKGTISKIIAQNLGFHYLDSGALYRIIAHVSELKNIAVDDETALARLAADVDIRFSIKPLKGVLVTRVYADKEEVTEHIYTESCGQRASKVAALPLLRQGLLEVQRRFAEPPGLVADGRDMGTVVFPSAEAKIFLTASLEERAKRRFKQLKDLNSSVTIEKICDSLSERDRRDSSRDAAPLKAAEDARIIDTTSLTVSEVVEGIMASLPLG